MKKLLKITIAMLAVMAFFTACQHEETNEVDLFAAQGQGLTAMSTPTFDMPQPAFPLTFNGVSPLLRPGNFASSDDDQVCYDMVEQGLIEGFDGDMRGFKIDPPTGFNNTYVSVLLSDNKKYLAWATESSANMLAIIVKGGPNYHVYDYTERNDAKDSWLVSPLNKRNIPDVSHYNVCYTVTTNGEQGCTPGYWRNHKDRWVGYSPCDFFNEVFGVDLLGEFVTLGMVLDNVNLYGAFAFHAVAALLNTTGGTPNTGDGETVNYPYDTDFVIGKVKEAFANEEFNTTKDLFVDANELGCPLSGSRAVRSYTCP